MNKYAIVDVKGGLGNQLFTISFAEYLNQNGYKVLVDTSFYKSSHDHPRVLNIDIGSFGFKEINFSSDTVFKLLNTRFEEVENLNYINAKIVNRFKRYYQNTLFLDKAYLIKKLSLDNKKYPGSVLVHLRRDDYIKLNEELKLEYYKEAVNRIEKKLGNFEISIFSDDHSLKIDDFKNFNVTNIFNDKNSDALDTFREMTRFQNFVISNSTFSFLAAFLGEDTSSTIYYPRPWMRNSNVEIKNFPDNWIPLLNK